MVQIQLPQQAAGTDNITIGDEQLHLLVEDSVIDGKYHFDIPNRSSVMLDHWREGMLCLTQQKLQYISKKQQQQQQQEQEVISQPHFNLSRSTCCQCPPNHTIRTSRTFQNQHQQLNLHQIRRQYKHKNNILYTPTRQLIHCKESWALHVLSSIRKVNIVSSLFLVVAWIPLVSTGGLKCSLPCKNAGICMKGKDHSVPGEESSVVITNYCSCPVGYTGAYCEIKYSTCPSLGICFNGAVCQVSTTDNGDNYTHCECDPVNSDLSTPYSRQFCQHASTIFCSNTNMRSKVKDQYRNSLGNVAKSSFCMNGGRCKDNESNTLKQQKGTYHAGCICTDGWTGPHCEIPDSNNPLSMQPDNPDPYFLHKHIQLLQHNMNNKNLSSSSRHRSFSSYVMSFMMAFLVIFTTIAAVYWMYLNYYVTQERRPRSSNSSDPSSSAQRRAARRKKTAAERARIPKRQPSSSTGSSRGSSSTATPALDENGGYSSGASSQSRRRRGGGIRQHDPLQSPQSQQQQQHHHHHHHHQRGPVSEIELM